MRQSVVHTFFNLLWKHAPTLSKKIIKRLFFTPTTYKSTPVEREYLDNAKKFEVSIHDKAVKCWKWGSGPSILLAHGWNGRGIQLHHFIEPLRQSGYSAIAYDAPGHGESQGSTSSYFEFTDTIRTLLTSPNGHEIRGVIAHSLGGSAAVNTIEKENLPLKAVLIAPALRLKEVLYGFFDYVGVPRTIYELLIKEYEDQFGYNMHRDNPVNLLREIHSKILIVHDTNDPTIPYVDSKGISDRFPNIELHTTERLGHKKILADSSVINHAINYFGEQPLKKEGKEMSKSINILEEYRKGDLDRRLNLFLECPSLRAEFLEIDQSEAVGHSLFETSHQEGP
jgi:pimeloyl-ACP methyl ester carboxylesterase